MAETSIADNLVFKRATMDDAEDVRGRLTALERHAISTEKRLDAVDLTLNNHGSKLDAIMAAVTEQRALRGPGLSEMIRTASSFATAGAILAALMIYIITSVMQGPLTTLSERQTVIRDNVKEETALVDQMREELTLTKERLRLITLRLDSGEFLRGWQATVAYTKPSS